MELAACSEDEAATGHAPFTTKLKHSAAAIATSTSTANNKHRYQCFSIVSKGSEDGTDVTASTADLSMESEGFSIGSDDDGLRDPHDGLYGDEWIDPSVPIKEKVRDVQLEIPFVSVGNDDDSDRDESDDDSFQSNDDLDQDYNITQQRKKLAQDKISRDMQEQIRNLQEQTRNLQEQTRNLQEQMRQLREERRNRREQIRQLREERRNRRELIRSLRESIQQLEQADAAHGCNFPWFQMPRNSAFNEEWNETSHAVGGACLRGFRTIFGHPNNKNTNSTMGPQPILPCLDIPSAPSSQGCAMPPLPATPEGSDNFFDNLMGCMDNLCTTGQSGVSCSSSNVVSDTTDPNSKATRASA